MNKNLKLKLIIAIFIVIGFFIWKSDTFQKAVFPQKYWAKEVSQLEELIEINSWFIDLESEGYIDAPEARMYKFEIQQKLAYARRKLVECK